MCNFGFGYDKWYVCGMFKEIYFVLEVMFFEYVVMICGDDNDCIVEFVDFFEGFD